MALASSLRSRVLVSTAALVAVSLLGTAFSIHRIAQVSQALDAINRAYVPFGKILAQIAADGEVLRRELDKSLGKVGWADPRWRPRPFPRWASEVVGDESVRARELAGAFPPGPDRARWLDWSDSLVRGFASVRDSSVALQGALESADPKREEAAAALYPQWAQALAEWSRLIETGHEAYERALRREFEGAEARVRGVKSGLQALLAVVVFLSLLFLWIGERALRPLGDLTRLARQIATRGLRKQDKALLPEALVARDDEVNELAREFHRMATALLEREATVESQNRRLEEQNRQLRELGEMRERLREAESLAAVGRMSAQVAHEVRNPLHSIGLEAELALDLVQGLEQGARQKPALAQAIHSVLAGVDRLGKITENYLRLTRLSAGRREPVHLGDLLQRVLATYATQCERQGVRVEWSGGGHGESSPVIADADLLEQALGNLIRNSLQAFEVAARPAEGNGVARIRVRLSTLESGALWMRVEDNGPGIAEKIRDRIFTPFLTTRAQGTGLGLAFVKRVVEEHGGAIELARGEWGGACFDIRLPPAVAENLAAHPVNAEARP